MSKRNKLFIITITLLVIRIAGYIFIHLLMNESLLISDFAHEISRLLESLMLLLGSIYVISQEDSPFIFKGRYPYELQIIASLFLLSECFPFSILNGLSGIVLLGNLAFVSYEISQNKAMLESVSGWCVVGAIFAAVFVFVFLVPTQIPEISETNWMARLFQKEYSILYWVQILLSVLSHFAVLEETIFRYILFVEMKKRGIDLRLALFIQAILFAVAHIGKNSVGSLVSAFVFSLGLGLITLLTKKLRPAIVGHVTYDFLLYFFAALSV